MESIENEIGDPVKDYVQNFSETKHVMKEAGLNTNVAAMGFAG